MYLHECVVSQTVVELLSEQGEVLRAVKSQHGIQEPGATRQHHRVELERKERKILLI